MIFDGLSEDEEGKAQRRTVSAVDALRPRSSSSGLELNPPTRPASFANQRSSDQSSRLGRTGMRRYVPAVDSGRWCQERRRHGALAVERIQLRSGRQERRKLTKERSGTPTHRALRPRTSPPSLQHQVCAFWCIWVRLHCPSAVVWRAARKGREREEEGKRENARRDKNVRVVSVDCAICPSAFSPLSLCLSFSPSLSHTPCRTEACPALRLSGG